MNKPVFGLVKSYRHFVTLPRIRHVALEILTFSDVLRIVLLIDLAIIEEPRFRTECVPQLEQGQYFYLIYSKFIPARMSH